LQGQKVLYGLTAEAALEDLDKPEEIYGVVVADVVEPVGRVAGAGVGKA
jgi:hypothetical protein